MRFEDDGVYILYWRYYVDIILVMLKMSWSRRIRCFSTVQGAEPAGDIMLNLGDLSVMESYAQNVRCRTRDTINNMPTVCHCKCEAILLGRS
jgi:hypothetical protein